MSKIERRRRVVPLQHGHYEAKLAALFDKVMAAQRAEAADTTANAPRRAGQRRPQLESVKLATEYDQLQTEAEESAREVVVWAITHDEWSQLLDDHPPRDDIPEDKENGVAAKKFDLDKTRGVNTKTFPPLLLRASLTDPDEDLNLDERIANGEQILKDLKLSQIHYVKLETGAWNVNVGDDALPKFSLVSFLNQGSDGDSKPLNDSV